LGQQYHLAKPSLSFGSAIPFGQVQSKSSGSGQLNPLAVANVPIKVSLAPCTIFANVTLFVSAPLWRINWSSESGALVSTYSVLKSLLT